MNYAHDFHAGNFADIVKHAALAASVAHLARKAKPFVVIDSHAGSGLYDLESPESLRSAEAAGGIGRLADRPEPGEPALIGALRAVLDLVDDGRGPTGLRRRYPGSPLIAALAMRPGDRLIAAETVDPVRARLDRVLAARVARPGPRIETLRHDGYSVLKACLPPGERRGLAIIDPPFEDRDEFDRLGRAIEEALIRWASGSYLIWYPVKDVLAADDLAERIAYALPEHVTALRAELSVVPPGLGGGSPLAAGLTTTGLIAINPAWPVEEGLAPLLDWCAQRLARDPARPGHASVTALTRD